jgi:RNA polymerase sigma-70 factor (ECF subfamily)
MNFGDEKKQINTLSDEALVVGMKENPDFLGEIIDRYEKKLFFYIKRNSGLDDEIIEDLLQDIFLAVYQNAQSFNKNLKFSSWVYRIAHNKMIDY